MLPKIDPWEYAMRVVPSLFAFLFVATMFVSIETSSVQAQDWIQPDAGVVLNHGNGYRYEPHSYYLPSLRPSVARYDRYVPVGMTTGPVGPANGAYTFTPYYYPYYTVGIQSYSQTSSTSPAFLPIRTHAQSYSWGGYPAFAPGASWTSQTTLYYGVTTPSPLQSEVWGP